MATPPSRPTCLLKRGSSVVEIQSVFNRFADTQGNLETSALKRLLEALDLRFSDYDVGRVLRKIDQDGNGSVSFEEFLKFLSLRVIKSVRRTSLVDTRLTVLHSVFQQGDSRLEAWVFRAFAKGKGWAGSVFWIMWYIGVLLGLISQQTLWLPWLPWRFCFSMCGLLTVPLPCLCLLVLSMDLVKSLLLEVQFYVILFFQITWAAAVFRVLGDARCIFWLSLMPSMWLAALSDAYPGKYRTKYQRKLFSGLLLCMGWWAFTIGMDFNEPIHDETWHFKLMISSVPTSSVVNALTLSLFILNNLHCAVMMPDQFVLICSASRTEYVQVKDLSRHLLKNGSSACLTELSDVEDVLSDVDIDKVDSDNVDTMSTVWC